MHLNDFCPQIHRHLHNSICVDWRSLQIALRGASVAASQGRLILAIKRPRNIQSMSAMFVWDRFSILGHEQAILGQKHPQITFKCILAFMIRRCAIIRAHIRRALNLS